VSDPGIALRTAIHAALDAALSVNVHDHVPQGSAYPYVTIGSEQSRTADFLNSRKERKDIYLSVYSTYRGEREVLDIMGEISAALHNKKLALSAGRIAGMQVMEKDTNPEPDGLTYMGRVRLSVLVEHG
jgi:hypothetical protein